MTNQYDLEQEVAKAKQAVKEAKKKHGKDSLEFHKAEADHKEALYRLKQFVSLN